jgi:hypothetical protein
MNRKVICLVGLAVLLVTGVITFSWLNARVRHMQQLHDAAVTGDSQAFAELAGMNRRPYARYLVQQLAVEAETDPRIRVAAFQVIGADSEREASLCRYVGEFNGEMDEQAEDLFLNRVAAQPKPSRECVHAVLQRLMDLPKAQGEPAQHQNPRRGPLVTLVQANSYEVSEEVDRLKERIVAVLRRHPGTVADLLRKQYGLGSANPQPSALPAAVALREMDSCPDIQRSQENIEASGGMYAADYRDAAAMLCTRAGK